MNKKIMLWLFSLLLLTLPATALAQAFVPLAGIPGLTLGVTADQTGLANFFNNLYKYLIGLAAVLAVIEIIWGGLLISTQDSISKKGEGKEKIQNAIFGLVLVLSPVLVFSIINPSILNLSLNLPPLDTTTVIPSSVPDLPAQTSGGVGGTEDKFLNCTSLNCSSETTTCAPLTNGTIGATPYTPVVVCALSGSIDPDGATSSNGENATACKTNEKMVVDCRRSLPSGG